MNKNYKSPPEAYISLIVLVAVLSIVLCAVAFQLLGRTLGAVIAFLLILAACACIIYIPLSLKRILIILTDDEIIFHSGIFIRCQRRMKRSSLELVYLIKTPFSEWTGLCFVSLCVYGKSLVLPFLSAADAGEICSILENSIRQRKEKPDVS